MFDPGIEPHQFLYVCKYMDRNSSVAMLAVKRSASAAPEMNQRNPLHTHAITYANEGIHSGFETQGRPKQGYQWSQKRLKSSFFKFFFFFEKWTTYKPTYSAFMVNVQVRHVRARAALNQITQRANEDLARLSSVTLLPHLFAHVVIATEMVTGGQAGALLHAAEFSG